MPNLVEIYLYHLRYYLESYGTDFSLLEKNDFVNQLCELRLHAKIDTDISVEFQKYYSFSLDEIKYRKLKNGYYSFQKQKMESDKVIERQNSQIAKYQEMEKCNISEIGDLKQKNVELQSLVEELLQNIQVLETEKHNVEENLHIMLNSTIYKATKPLRRALDFIKKI